LGYMGAGWAASPKNNLPVTNNARSFLSERLLVKNYKFEVMMTHKKIFFANYFILMFIVAFSAQAYGKDIPWYESISPQESAQLIQSNKDNPGFVILDIRTPAEVSQGKIENSIQLNFFSQSFAANLHKLDKQSTYLVYCRSGNRSGKTLEIMKIMKFSRVYNMRGGFRGWNYQGLPIVK